MKRNILVAGLGLIGGSLLKALRNSAENHLLGYDVNSEVLDYALRQHIIDEGFSDWAYAAQKADIIILAAPISASIELLEKLNEVSFSHEVIVSDVSSVKGTIFLAASQLTNENILFIGGHPMAGSHKTGIEAAKAHLFENAIYVLTPTMKCPEKRVNELKQVLHPTRSQFLTLQPEEHDEMTSVISHFPHLVASSLVHQAKK